MHFGPVEIFYACRSVQNYRKVDAPPSFAFRGWLLPFLPAECPPPSLYRLSLRCGYIFGGVLLAFHHSLVFMYGRFVSTTLPADLLLLCVFAYR